jgi:malate dehydrogenase (oxaloacetate-decarboxylating)(NADP+)
MTIRTQEVLEYHARGRPGKVQVVPTKPCLTQRDLSMAYTPGVAEACRAIVRDPHDIFRYTARGNLVAVVSDGTAVLGLGAIGPEAGKPVMEGKGVLFKRFADIDVFDLEVRVGSPEEFVAVVKALEPTFGGINLEDVKAPECFFVEERLKAILDIPVFHDDQHGTAIIASAALLNALEVAGKEAGSVRVVFSGAGAAAIATGRMFLRMGVRRENMEFVDRAGVIYRGREQDMNPHKLEFAADTPARTLAQAMAGADVFVGLSVGGLVNEAMVRSMAPHPIVFAMANPDPEIGYAEATAARPDLIMATGRSDYPNQVNNVLGFPFIFRGALDVRARAINDEMKVAASRALAALAHEDVPDEVRRCYSDAPLRFGPEYLIPKPFDPRVLIWEASAVARAAMETGVAREPISDLDAYRERLEGLLGRSHQVVRSIINKARREKAQIVFPEGEEDKVLRASQVILDERIAVPVLLGDVARMRGRVQELGLDLDGVRMLDPSRSGALERYASELFQLRKRKGVTPYRAERMVRDRQICAMMMVALGDADGVIAGIDHTFSEVARPALQIVGLKPGVKRAASAHMMVLGDRVLLFADTTMNIEPTAEELKEIAILAARTARRFDIEPRVAMISFANFGAVRHPVVEKVAQAVALVRRELPDLVIDGEMQADTALVPELAKRNFPDSAIPGNASVLIFPDLGSANVAFKLLHVLAGVDAIGPILMGMARPVNVLDYSVSVETIVHMAAITAVQAEMRVRGERPARETPEVLVDSPVAA